MINKESTEDIDRDLCERWVPVRSNQNDHPMPPDTICDLEIELDPLVTGASTVPAIFGHKIFVLAEKKQLLRHEGPHPAEKLVGKREISGCPRETDVPALDVDIVEDPR